MSSPSGPIVPKTVALDQIARSVGWEKLPDTMDEIVHNARDAQQQLGAAASDHDFARLASLAGGLRTDCGYLGATGLARRLADLQMRAERRDLADPLSAVDSVMAELDAFLEALGDRLERSRGG